MTDQKPHILVTNDDGVNAPGLLALVKELRRIGEVTVLAPDHNWSASGHAKTLHRPLRVRATSLADGSLAYSSDGAPSDCVALALLGYIETPPSLVVSGINPNANVGHDVTYSGTVTAAMEAAIAGVAAIAVSMDSPEHAGGPFDFRPAARAGRRAAALVLRNGLPEGCLLNVNVPGLPEEEIRGWRVTRQGQRIYRDELIRREDPRGKPYYWIGGEAPSGVEEEDTDYGAIKKGYISVTPIQLDLTDHKSILLLEGWKWPRGVVLK
jgi:5'-nucleotidase